MSEINKDTIISGTNKTLEQVAQNTSTEEIVIGDSNITEDTKAVINEVDYIPYVNSEVNIGATNPNNIRTWFKQSRNLFNKDLNIVTPGYIDASGNVVTSDATLSYQNYFIQVKPNTQYTISSNTSTIYRIAEYNLSTTFIQREYNSSASTSYTITTTANTYYIKMAGTLTTVLDTLQIEEGSSSSSYEPYTGYKQISINNNTFTESVSVGTDENNSRVWFKKSANLFNFADIEVGYLSGAGNVISNNYYSSSNYIYIKGFSKITVSGNSGNNENICFYDSGKTFISYETTGSNTSMTLNVPNNAYYVRATVKNTNLNQYQLEEGSTATTYEPYNLNSINVDNEEIYSTPVILYNSTTGTTGNVTLSDSKNNYRFIEIFYKDDQDYASSMKIKGSDTGFILQYNKTGINQDTIYLYDTRYTINNNIITVGISLTLALKTSGISVNGTTNLIYITKVVGYK